MPGHTKQVLADYKRWHPPTPTFDSPATRKIAEELSRLYSDGSSPPPAEDLSVILPRLLSAADRGDFSSLTIRDWRFAAWCLWLRAGDGRILGNHPVFPRYFFARLRSKADYKRLIYAWLEHYDPNSVSVRQAADLIIDACKQWPDWPWAHRHQKHLLFDVRYGPDKVAAFLVTPYGTVSDSLKELGLTGSALNGRFGEAAHISYLGELVNEFSSNQPSNKLHVHIASVADWALGPGPKPLLRYPKTKVALVKSLLMPWRHRQPEPSVQKSIQTLLLQAIGDPRIDPAGWPIGTEEARQILIRWLIGASIELFIKIIEQVADSGHWKFRRQYWMAYYNEGHIVDAWIVLGRDAQVRAKKINELEGGFGTVKGTGAQSGHCVLLMRIESLVIADWSHNGACRIWSINDPRAPKLYQHSYDTNELRNQADEDLVINHHGSKDGHWQRKASAAIRQRARVSVPEWKYL